MKLLSWNVNGIRSIIKKDSIKNIEKENPDIICLQEIKANQDQVDKIFEGYENHIWNSAEKKGYSGTAIFSKIKPLSVKFGKELLEDNEGRVIVAEFNHFFLVNVYTPNSQRGLLRLKERLVWDKKFLALMKSLENKKPVVFCGDLNVAHKEIDIARPKDNVKNAGFTPEERASFDNYISHGFIDSFRHFNPNAKDSYTWWSPMHNARSKNIGWRIDYFCISNSLKSNLTSAHILKEINGSDHCPISINLKFN
ncbi:exodeoxyribonuclease III [Candidatus Pacearchaeota archaeon]|nr:exodeoxyribonuclease III [Candidatus Pacearchaeota archaeon]